MTLDGLVSFTYIPGTVVHLGYGSALEELEWDEGLPGFAKSDRYNTMERAFFSRSATCSASSREKNSFRGQNETFRRDRSS